MVEIEYFLNGESKGVFDLKERNSHTDRVICAVMNDVGDFDRYILDDGRVEAKRVGIDDDYHYEILKNGKIESWFIVHPNDDEVIEQIRKTSHEEIKPNNKYQIGDLVEYKSNRYVIRSAGGHWFKVGRFWICAYTLCPLNTKGTKPDMRSWNTSSRNLFHLCGVSEKDLKLKESRFYQDENK